MAKDLATSRQKVRKASGPNVGSNRTAIARHLTTNSESESEATPSPQAYQPLDNRPSKTPRTSPTKPSEWEKTHRKCLKILDEAEDDKDRLSKLLAQERQHSQQAAQQYRTEQAQLSAQIQQLAADKKQAMEECERVRGEALQLQNRLDSAVNANSLGQWPHAEMESFLGMIHAELSATATRVWGRREEFKNSLNSYLSTFMPASDVLQQPWSQTSGPMGDMGNHMLPHASLPGTQGPLTSINPLVPSSGV